MPDQEKRLSCRKPGRSDTSWVPGDTPAVSFVIPVFRNAATLSPLVARLTATVADIPCLGMRFEIIFIDDGSDDHSWNVIVALHRDNGHVRGVRLPGNRGQHTAALKGLQVARASRIIVMDADLQDRPEVVVDLLRLQEESRADVVFAGRVGSYQGRSRMVTSRLYRKYVLEKLVGLPCGAGMFFVVTRPVLEHMLALSLPGKPMVIGLLAAIRPFCVIIPAPRSQRSHGKSAYTAWKRLCSAACMVRCAFFAGKGSSGPLLSDYLSAIEPVDSLS